jgi:hypothetical protein
MSVRTGCVEPLDPLPVGAGADGAAGLNGALGVPPGAVDAAPLTTLVSPAPAELPAGVPVVCAGAAADDARDAIDPAPLPPEVTGALPSAAGVSGETNDDTAPHTAEVAPLGAPPLSADWTVASAPAAVVVAVPVA